MTVVTAAVSVPVLVKRCVYCDARKGDTSRCSDGGGFHVFHEREEHVTQYARVA